MKNNKDNGIKLATFMHYFATDPDLQYKVLEAMRTYGGSFVKQLSILYWYGDPNNQAKLLKCFADYFAHYYITFVANNDEK